MSEDVNALFWSLEFSTVIHVFENADLILFPVALFFMLLIVSAEMTNIHTSATQNFMFVEAAHRERNHNDTGMNNVSAAGLCAARELLFLVREFTIISVLEPTVASIISVSTSYDIIFCGSIVVVVLQADQ